MSGRLLRRAGARSWARHPLQLALAVLGVTLGVGVAVSVDLANQSALAAYRLANDAVTGQTTHQIVGGSRGVPEELFRDLRAEGVRAAPVLEGWVRAPSGRSLRLLGVDPLAEAGVRGYLAGSFGGGGVDVAALMTEPGAVTATAETAAALELAPGEALEVLVDGQPATVRLAAPLRVGSELRREGLRDVLVADVSTAQEVLDRVGTLTRIDLVLEDGASARRLRESLPPGVRLAEAAARADATVEMSRAFRLNLTAMSLLAVVCGAFLIYNTMTFAVVRRRELIGLLRALGVTRREVFALILGEAAGIGLLGTALGVGSGILLAGGMVRLVTRTLNDLYFAVSVRAVTVSPESLATALLLGVGATLAAALAPAREATRAVPRSVLLRSGIESRARDLAPSLAIAGAVLAAAAVALIVWPGGGLVGSFAGLFTLLLGASLLAPGSTLVLARTLRRPLARLGGSIGNLAARGVEANLSRTAVAVAALMVAVSVIIGVGTMVESFRRSLVDWLGYTLQADLYVSPVGRRGPDDTLELASEEIAALRADPRITGVGTIRRVEVESAAGRLQLLVLDPGPEGRAAYEILDGGDDAWDRFLAGETLASEPLASRLGLAPGDRVSVATPAGEEPLVVAGVFRSYASDRGALLLSRGRYRELWSDPTISGLSLRLRDDADAAAVREELVRRFAGRQQVSVLSNRRLRAESLAVFDRTFLITGVLRALVTLVAFVGVFSALMAMALERGRELGVLRATGLTPAQLFGVLIGQTGVLGLIAGLLALPLGLALARVMIHVINRRAFGWSLQMHVPAGILGEALVLAVGAALLAGIVPALRRAWTLPAAALREE